MQLIELNQFVSIINEYYSINMIENSREKTHVRARFMFFEFARKYTRFSFSQIGSILMKKHCTVIHGIRTLKNDIKQDKTVALEYNELQEKLHHFNNKDKVFLAIPVNYLIEVDFKEYRNQARAKYMNVLNLKPSYVMLPNDNLFLVHTLDLILTCKTVIMLTGWESCKICQIQHEYAKFKNITIKYEI
jgi:hypothetical protein